MNPRREEIDGAQGVVASLMDIMVIIFIIIIIFVVVVIVCYFKCKRNPCQHGLVKSKCTISSLVSYLYHISPLVFFLQRPVDDIYFDVSSSIDLVPHTCLLLKLSPRGLSDSYVGCVVDVTLRYSRYVLEPREVLSCIFQGTVLGACVI